MSCGLFTEIVMDHFQNPRNVGFMEGADAEGKCGEASCGDFLTIFIKVKDNKIFDISFLVFGCVAAIASSSMTTVLAKGKSLEDALMITDKDIAYALGGLPHRKMHCSVLGATALKDAIKHYLKKKEEKKLTDNKFKTLKANNKGVSIYDRKRKIMF